MSEDVRRDPREEPWEPGELWSYKEIAAHIGVQPATVRSYRKLGHLPPPDAVRDGRPYWRQETVRRWVANRPGRRRGRRT
ncbi:helix-turn-helix transcriptional regulator [Streptomyces hoynatensis]|uniref:MerR family transcriptional regulator n=1 Tax=Streptomyces hoynatensis TaxID=1141874 RepID=A0A3A9ZFK4_9ACTN|nr:MerR family transcriptional regulator [Streptomyces hoynatensis]RKN47181.1 MerR family transcriptional regulator [Streptomyces hoynatensis]